MSRLISSQSDASAALGVDGCACCLERCLCTTLVRHHMPTLSGLAHVLHQTSELPTLLIGPQLLRITCWKAVTFPDISFCANCGAQALFANFTPAVALPSHCLICV